jgi:DNA-binding MarR family transcriptional regulator
MSVCIAYVFHAYARADETALTTDGESGLSRPAPGRLDGHRDLCADTHMDLNHPLNCLTFNLQRASRNLVRGFEASAKESGLTAPQFATMSLLAGYGQAQVTQLAEHLGTDRTTLTRNLDLLARKGWIEEVAAQDARLHLWTLTPLGRERLSAAIPIWQKYQAGLVERLGTTNAEDLLAILSRL